jgi:hypothetical protein
MCFILHFKLLQKYKKFCVVLTCTQPLLFPLSAEAKKGNALVYNNIAPSHALGGKGVGFAGRSFL